MREGDVEGVALGPARSNYRVNAVRGHTLSRGGREVKHIFSCGGGHPERQDGGGQGQVMHGRKGRPGRGRRVEGVDSRAWR